MYTTGGFFLLTYIAIAPKTRAAAMKAYIKFLDKLNSEFAEPTSRPRLLFSVLKALQVVFNIL